MDAFLNLEGGIHFVLDWILYTKSVSSFSLSLLYHAYVYLEFLILACTIYILALVVVFRAPNVI